MVPCKVVIQLLKNQPFQNFTQWRQDSDWSIVLSLKRALLLVKRYDLPIFPARRKLLLQYRQGNYMVEWFSNNICRYLYSIIVAVVGFLTYLVHIYLFWASLGQHVKFQVKVSQSPHQYLRQSQKLFLRSRVQIF